MNDDSYWYSNTIVGDRADIDTRTFMPPSELLAHGDVSAVAGAGAVTVTFWVGGAATAVTMTPAEAVDSASAVDDAVRHTLAIKHGLPLLFPDARPDGPPPMTALPGLLKAADAYVFVLGPKCAYMPVKKALEFANVLRDLASDARTSVFA